MLTGNVNETNELNDAPNANPLFYPKLGNDTATYTILAALSTLITPRLYRLIDKLIDWLRKQGIDDSADRVQDEAALLSDLQSDVLLSLVLMDEGIPRGVMFFARDLYGHIEDFMYGDRLNVTAKWNVYEMTYNIASIQSQYEDPEIKIDERSASTDTPEYIPVTFDRLHSYLASVRQDSFDWIAQFDIDDHIDDDWIEDFRDEDEDDEDFNDDFDFPDDAEDDIEDLKDKIKAIGTSVNHIIKVLDELPIDLKDTLLLP